MARELDEIPLLWHEKVPAAALDMVARRRHRYIVNAKELEAEGYVPVSQVTMASGKLLRVGEDDVRYMVEGRLKAVEERRIRRDFLFDGKELEFRYARGTVVPRVEPHKVSGPADIHASRTGFTVYVKPGVMFTLLTDMVRQPIGLVMPLGVSQQRRRIRESGQMYIFNSSSPA